MGTDFCSLNTLILNLSMLTRFGVLPLASSLLAGHVAALDLDIDSQGKSSQRFELGAVYSDIPQIRLDL